MHVACRGGKVHAVREFLDDGTKVMLCGLAQQRPFYNSVRRPCCYGEWTVTARPIDCIKCLAAAQQGDLLREQPEIIINGGNNEMG